MKVWRLRSAESWTAAPMAAVCAFPKALPATVSMATAWTSPACPVSVRNGSRGKSKREFDQRVIRNFITDRNQAILGIRNLFLLGGGA